MDALLFDWPYLGLALAAGILAWLLLEKRPAGAPPRAQDPGFLLGLLGPLYLVHQFEEHGIDLFGRHYAFLGSLCRTLGFADLARCPADPRFIFAVNPVGCWIAFALALAFRRRNPLVAACAWGIPAVNFFAHAGPALFHGAYNPGLFTAVVLFIPGCLYVLRACLRAGAIQPGDLPRVMATGGVIHALLIGSMLWHAHGLPEGLTLAVNALDGLLPLAFGTVGARPAAQTLISS